MAGMRLDSNEYCNGRTEWGWTARYIGMDKWNEARQQLVLKRINGMTLDSSEYGWIEERLEVLKPRMDEQNQTRQYQVQEWLKEG